jgi:hypothetical protein
MNPVSLIITLVLLLGASGSLRALEFRVLSWEGEIKGLKYDNGSKTTEIVALDSAFSPVYFLKNSTKLELYRDTEDPENNGGRESLVVLAAPEASVTRAILILAPGGGGSFFARWIDDSPAMHPANTLRVHNFTRKPLAFQSNGEQWRLGPSEVYGVSIPTSARQIPLQIAEETDGKWAIVWGSQLPVRKNYRVHVFVRGTPLPGEAKNSHVYPFILYDYVMPKPVETGAN